MPVRCLGLLVMRESRGMDKGCNTLLDRLPDRVLYSLCINIHNEGGLYV